MSDSFSSKLKSTILFHYGESTLRHPQFIRLHQHEFWQIQLATGAWELVTTEGDIPLRKNDVVIVPPRTPHGFRHEGKGEAYFAAMFQLRGFEISPATVIAPRTHFVRKWVSCLRSLLAEASDASIGAPLASLLDALLPMVIVCQSPSIEVPACVQRAEEFIRKNVGRQISVEETARHAGMARGYLSGLFKQSTGKTIKQSIDHHRLELAKRMLHYSDLSITQIAEQLDFPDVFTFSHFFKRNGGESPNQFRAEARIES